LLLTKTSQKKSLEEDEDDDTVLLELKTEEGKAKKDLEEFFPFMGAGYGMGQGYGYGGYGANYGYGYPQQQPQQPQVSSAVLEQKSTAGKISALKYFFIQLTATQSDVQMGYWMNKALSTILPQQFAMFKLYKNYLSTFAVSSAIQLQDAFTMEAYLEDFNQNFKFAGNSAQLTEAIAERNVFTQWQQLVTMRLYLFYISMYESSMAQMGQMGVATPVPTPAAASFLEVEAEPAEPSKQSDPQSAMLMQYMYMYYTVRMIKFYTIFMEMQVPQVGLQMATFKSHGWTLLTDDRTDNDADGRKWVDHANRMDNFVVPQVISQWSSMVSTRYYMEFYLFMFDMYLPQMATQRVMARVDSAMLNTNLLQKEPAKVFQPAQ